MKNSKEKSQKSKVNSGDGLPYCILQIFPVGLLGVFVMIVVLVEWCWQELMRSVALITPSYIRVA